MLSGRTGDDCADDGTWQTPRMNVGKIGVWTTFSQFGAERGGEAALWG